MASETITRNDLTNILNEVLPQIDDLKKYSGNNAIIKASRDGHIVTLSIGGSVTITTSGGSSYISGINLPSDFRPVNDKYFLVASSGNTAGTPYLAYVTANGQVGIYTRGESIGYLYGSTAYSTFD